MREDVRRHAQHAGVMDQRGQHRVCGSATQFGIVADNAAQDARRGQAVTGNEVSGPAGVAFEEPQRAALLGVLENLLGQSEERLLVERLPGVEGCQ